MNPLILLALTYGTHAVDFIRIWFWSIWNAYWAKTSAPTSRYFLGESTLDVNATSVVPPDAVYLEEWIQDGSKKCVVRYAGETIPQSWTSSPFAKHPRAPWIWVGDRQTEIDMTRTFSKFLVVGNRITRDLVERLIRVGPTTKLIYLEARTFKELEFPGVGITIEEYGPLCDRGSVHHIEETMPSPIVDECDHSPERNDLSSDSGLLLRVPGGGGIHEGDLSSDDGTQSLDRVD